MSLTPYQQSIVKRYYRNLDGLALQKLGELVSELALCDSQKKADRLWERASKSMKNAGMKPEDIDPLVQSRDVAAFAEVVGRLNAR
ncbi:MAG: hypothetical protein KDA21_13995 [Phycisphaerales bacterium]|nr:hypothetical protein [Phycisphaerales bacterium]